MKQISLTKGKIVLVDDEDFDYLNQFKWHVVQCKSKFYAARKVNSKNITMHRFMTNAKKGQIVDHKDRDGLNNQRFNLRFCTKRQNSFNSAPSGYRRYKGVSLIKAKPKRYKYDRWVARIKTSKKAKSLGVYKTPEEAALAYNKAAKEHYGKFAFLNEVDMKI